MAFGAIKALVDAGRSVPEDVSVVGFDDVPNAAFSRPALTTIRHPFQDVGALGIETLIGVIEHPDKAGEEIPEPPGELVIRDSTAPARRAAAGGGRRT
jgi:DNA-binding LacI/PurR family transcriptional regulator